jgi:phosphotransferase system  glucose/maltose/N-acetylglucosamine-specific IIC component
MATCLTAGSGEPSAFYIGLINTPMGRAVRQAVISRFDVRYAGMASRLTDEQLFINYMGIGKTWVGAADAPPELVRLFKAGQLTKEQIMNTSFFKNYAKPTTGAPSSLSKDEILDKIVAVYLQWTWVQVWNNRDNVSPEEIMADECLEKAVFTVAPASVDVTGPRGAVQDLSFGVWPWVVGGLLVAGIAVYFIAKKKKPASALGLATALGAT